LQIHHPSLWMDANGAGPNASIVGNFLERGFGHTPLGERASQFCSLEAVLGTGELLQTGFGQYPQARATYTYRYGVGPWLDGLFFQSNYGIVTKLGIWLMPKPEAFLPFACTGSEPGDIALLVERIGNLRRSGVLRSTVHIFNTLRSLTNRIAYPWAELKGRKPIPQEMQTRWAKDYGVGAWGASGAVYGPTSVVAASMKVIRETLNPLSLIELSEEKLNQLSPVEVKGFLPIIGLLQGTPTEFYLRAAAWRSQTQKPDQVDPLVNGAGLIWIVPTLPATAKDALSVKELVEGVMHSYGFDVPITFTFINDRTLTCTTNISYNREDAEDAEAAWACYQAIVPKLIESGYPPYRSGVGGYGLLDRGSNFWKTARNLKRVLDPDQIISPGHYIT
jgi:4-cresol dehydrogenase (hydroxylating) flavoprotein subunit